MVRLETDKGEKILSSKRIHDSLVEGRRRLQPTAHATDISFNMVKEVSEANAFPSRS